MVNMEMRSDRRPKVFEAPLEIICVSNGSRVGSRLSEDAVQTETFANGMQDKIQAVPFSAMQFPLSTGPQGWKKRPRSPGLKWYKDYDTPDALNQGRVLVIDYVKQGRLLPKFKYHVQGIDASVQSKT